MEIMTRDFGKIEIKKEEIIEFPNALPGFPGEKKFVLLPLAEDSPFIIMQSAAAVNLAFITVEPGNYIKDYEFEISDSIVNKLQIKDNEDILVLAIVTLKDELEKMTVNLAAPVLINLKEKLAKQIILDQEKYSLKYKLFADREKELVK